MRVVHSIAELEVWRRSASRATIGLVPTMGALHAGHRSLIGAARARADLVVVSIFVNPLQFGAGEDLDTYPRTLDADLAACQADGVDLVFAPDVAELYGEGSQVGVQVGTLGTILEGASRPGHFDGVLTVVAKLFNLVRPDIAVFGRKDAQQLACIRRMVTDLNFGVSIIGAPIIRDADGLALSSRNRYLSTDERASALALSRALAAGAAQTRAALVLTAAQRVLDAEPGVRTDYLKLVDPATFADIVGDHEGEALLLVAARVGSTRLIDNRLIALGPDRPTDPGTPA